MEELDMPVVVHVGIGSEGEGDTNALDILARPGIGFPYINKERLAIGFLDVASHMIVGGVLDRHPDLRFGCIESGIGWVPFFLEQTEDNWSRHRFWSDTLLSMRPSEFWTRQCFATFQIDHWGVASRAAVGINTVMWSSDYPHSGADWPESQRVIDEHLKDVPPDEQRLILSDNAARLYGLDINKLGRAQPPVGAGVRLS
jgi:predicted TIM-barrel fold metal-dependent hydrolase